MACLLMNGFFRDGDSEHLAAAAGFVSSVVGVDVRMTVMAKKATAITAFNP